MQLIIFFFYIHNTQIKELYSSTRRLTKQLIVHVFVESTQNYVSMYETTY
jgi:hypothetical protein